jgi:transcription initiation factor TFIIB
MTRSIAEREHAGERETGTAGERGSGGGDSAPRDEGSAVTKSTDEATPDAAVGETTCPECGSDDLVTSSDRGELVCDGCGLVVDEGTIDPGPEWRAFDHQERQEKSRVGAPTTQTMHDKGLTTTIDWKDQDAYGRSISSEKRSQMHRLRKWQERIRTKDAGERNLQFALSEVDRMASALGVPRSVREVASVIYRRALDADLIRGRSIEGVATASLYAACRKEGIPRSLEEIAEVSRVERKEIGRTYRYISGELELALEPVDPTRYVPRFCSELQLSEEVQNEAIDIIETTAEEGLLSGKSPTGYAAAAIYAASLLCNQKKTQREVAEVAQVTEVTIRNRYQEQIEAMGIH